MRRFVSVLVLWAALWGGCRHTAPAPRVAETASRFALPSINLTPAEKRVKDIVSGDGIHVIHFWAPWCGNSRSELQNGWYELIGQYQNRKDVTFTFVTIWNDGESGRDRMNQYLIPPATEEITTPNESSDDELRRKIFLGLPVTWIPTTWVFHQNGQLAYAFNYGELTMDQLRAAIEGAQSDWPHE